MHLFATKAYVPDGYARLRTLQKAGCELGTQGIETHSLTTTSSQSRRGRPDLNKNGTKWWAGGEEEKEEGWESAGAFEPDWG